MGDTYHVVPVDDLVGHEEEQDSCACGPHIEFFPQGTVVVHHALDGRRVDDSEWPRRRVHEVARQESLSEDRLREDS